MSQSPFELRVFPVNESEYGIELFQRQKEPDRKRKKLKRLVRVWGTPLSLTLEPLVSTLRDSGYKPSSLKRSRKTPFALDEEAGVRLGLLFLAVKPLRKTTRIEHISNAVRNMGVEEAYYWFSRCTADESKRRSQKALRILQASE
ncbi:hypothetical protein J7M28_13590 [bacterium]|nr:hypothetical protein [bacterium]